MLLLYLEGVRWAGAPKNAWLAAQMGEQDLYAWWANRGRALCAASKDEHIFDEATW